jgi:hypothetical protein
VTGPDLDKAASIGRVHTAVRHYQVRVLLSESDTCDGFLDTVCLVNYAYDQSLLKVEVVKRPESSAYNSFVVQVVHCEGHNGSFCSQNLDVLAILRE